MNRYQVYLEPKEVEIVDELAEDIGISRSRILQDVISRVVLEYSKIWQTSKCPKKKKSAFLKMQGIAKGASKVSLAENADEIYLID